MRPELICVLKSSRYSIVREVAGADPVAVFRWSILRAFFRAVSAFHTAAIKCTKRKGMIFMIFVKIMFMPFYLPKTGDLSLRVLFPVNSFVLTF